MALDHPFTTSQVKIPSWIKFEAFCHTPLLEVECCKTTANRLQYWICRNFQMDAWLCGDMKLQWTPRTIKSWTKVLWFLHNKWTN